MARCACAAICPPSMLRDVRAAADYRLTGITVLLASVSVSPASGVATTRPGWLAQRLQHRRPCRPACSSIGRDHNIQTKQTYRNSLSGGDAIFHIASGHGLDGRKLATYLSLMLHMTLKLTWRRYGPYVRMTRRAASQLLQPRSHLDQSTLIHRRSSAWPNMLPVGMVLGTPRCAQAGLRHFWVCDPSTRCCQALASDQGLRLQTVVACLHRKAT